MSFKVFINPGHDSTLINNSYYLDPGAVNQAYGAYECEIAKEVGYAVGYYLEKLNFEVSVLQQDDLYEVCSLANNWDADLFVSIHCNSAENKAALGTENLVYSFGRPSEDAARYIQNQIVKNLDMVDRPLKERPGLIVLNSTNMPAVLVEMGFISNEEDVQKLLNYKNEFAIAIAKGIIEYFMFK